MERLSNVKRQEKLAKVFKAVISAGLVVPVFVSASACKEPPAVVEEQEEKPTAEVPSETIQENKEETKETSSIVEETQEDSALETTLKEKVSFISEALPGAELNTKTGELTAKDKNEWGIKEGESIGWYVVNAFKMETADGLEEEQDAIGLIPPVIEAMQNKAFEEKGEKPFPIPINLKETEDIKITELKINSGMLLGVSSFGIKIPIETIIYSPFSGDYGFSPLTAVSKVETKDKSLGCGYGKDEKSSGQFSIDFVDGNIIPNIKTKAIPIENDEEILINVYELKLGDPLIEITGLSFLDQTANEIDDVWFFYENPGDYQLNLTHFKNIFEKMEPVSSTTVDFLGLKTNKESENIKVFILPNKPAYEQNN